MDIVIIWSRFETPGFAKTKMAIVSLIDIFHYKFWTLLEVSYSPRAYFDPTSFRPL